MKTKSKNAFLSGFALGILAPVIGMYFFTTLYLKSELKVAIDRMIANGTFTQALTIVVVLSNLFVFFVFNKRNEEKKLKGVIGATLIYALFIVFWEIFK